jgi:hypothetical protein
VAVRAAKKMQVLVHWMKVRPTGRVELTAADGSVVSVPFAAVVDVTFDQSFHDWSNAPVAGL